MRFGVVIRIEVDAAVVVALVAGVVRLPIANLGFGHLVRVVGSIKCILEVLRRIRVGGRSCGGCRGGGGV